MTENPAPAGVGGFTDTHHVNICMYIYTTVKCTHGSLLEVSVA